jgi:hypothetical protein
MNNLTQKGVNSISLLGRNRIDALKIKLISHLSLYLVIINILIIMLPKLKLQLSILLDDDEYHPKRNVMKISNIIYNERDDEFYS